MPDLKSSVWCPEFSALLAGSSVTDKTHSSGEELYLFLILFRFIVPNHCLESSALKSWWAGGEESMTTFLSLLFRPRPTEPLREQQSDRQTRPTKPCGGLNLFNCRRKYNLWWLFIQTTSPSLQILWNYGFQEDVKSWQWWQWCCWSPHIISCLLEPLFLSCL